MNLLNVYFFYYKNQILNVIILKKKYFILKAYEIDKKKKRGIFIYFN